MTGKIFINYRRGDDPGTTGRLYDRLEAEFSPGQLFMDVEGHIRGGDDFVEVLRAQVAQCDVLLAIIGPRWLEIADEQGRRRLDNPADWVRVEIAGALAGGKRVIPVLVGGADIPRAEDLPDDLKPLARRQVIRITPERFKADAQGLVNQIKGALAEAEARRHAETEADRAALAEAERQRQAAEDARVAERVRQEAERMRAAQLAGMDAAQVRKAEELANWEFIKSKTDAAELRDHIARFAGGPTERFAEERLAGLTWAALDRTHKTALRAFIDEFPKAPDTAAAETALAAVEAKEQAAREAAEARARETEAWWRGGSGHGQCGDRGVSDGLAERSTCGGSEGAAARIAQRRPVLAADDLEGRGVWRRRDGGGRWGVRGSRSPRFAGVAAAA